MLILRLRMIQKSVAILKAISDWSMRAGLRQSRKATRLILEAIDKPNNLSAEDERDIRQSVRDILAVAELAESEDV